MQAADRLKAATAFTPHYLCEPVERRANHVCRRFKYAGEYRRVAVIEKLDLVALGMDHFLDMILRMETADFFDCGEARRAGADPGAQRQLAGPFQKCALTVRSTWMSVWKTGTGQRLAGI